MNIKQSNHKFVAVRKASDADRFKISTRLLMLEALRKGYEVSFFPRSPLATLSGITKCEKAGKELVFMSTCTGLTPAYAYISAEDKVLTDSLLSGGSVRMPETVVISNQGTMDEAVQLLKEHGKVVVKPVMMNHGDGVTVGVTTTEHLFKAISHAQLIGSNRSDVIVQQQVEGKEYRFLVVEDKVIAVAHRMPPTVTGDGHSTVKELILEKNSDPRRGDGHSSELTKISLEDVERHRNAAFLRSVPARGENVQVLDTSNLSRGGESVNCTEIASPALKKMAVRAAQGSFLGIAGVDIIASDLTRDSLEGCYVIEVNIAPGLRMHQFPSIGESIDVAKIIFSAIEKTAHPVGKKMKHIGRSELVQFPEVCSQNIPARIDTGAAVSSLWASDISETEDGLSFVLFGKGSEYYTGEKVLVADYNKRAVSSSMGQTQIRYQIKLKMLLRGKKIRASITLADRSAQVYPVLIGRNVVRNKFIVDVSKGAKVYSHKEKQKRSELDAIAEAGSL